MHERPKQRIQCVSHSMPSSFLHCAECITLLYSQLVLRLSEAAKMTSQDYPSNRLPIYPPLIKKKVLGSGED